MKIIYNIVNVWKMSVGLVSGLVAIRFLQAVIPTIQIILVGEILTMATMAKIEAKWICSLMLCILFSWVCSGISNILCMFLMDKAEKTNEDRLTKAIIHTKYELLENNELQNQIKRVYEKTPDARISMLREGLSLASMVLRVLGILWVVLRFSVFGAFLVGVTFGPVIFYSIKSGKKQNELNKEVAFHERRVSYFDRLLSSREDADERLLFGFENYVMQKWENLSFEKLQKKIMGLKYWFIKSKTASLLSAGAIVFVLGCMLEEAYNNNNLRGIYISLASSLLGLVYMIATEFSRSLDQLAQANSVLVESNNLYNYLESNAYTVVSLDNKQDRVIHELEFRNVSFSYPNSTEKVLKNISFRVKQGECIAFVGENGAGKTTITRLLLGLYESYEGEILYNGLEVPKDKNAENRSFYSVVNQNTIRFPLSVEENICIGNIYKVRDKKYVYSVLDEIGLLDKVLNYGSKEETMLGKIYTENQDMSGGEWQKIAIGRTIYADKQIRILDEPAAALDPVAEKIVYEQFLRLLHDDKITILVSHRLGCVRNADRIYVLKDGMVFEEGNHKELMEKNGLYAEMYRTQSGWYR